MDESRGLSAWLGIVVKGSGMGNLGAGQKEEAAEEW
jgi:hypothetical protein